MSAKTKIVVLHMRETIYTLIFAGLAIILILLLIFMFLPNKDKKETKQTMKYVAGVYTSTIQLNDSQMDVQVVVDEERIQEISLVNLDETVATMYPLMEPAVQNINAQVVKTQSTDNISYDADQQYTSIVIVHAVEDALAKAKVE